MAHRYGPSYVHAMALSGDNGLDELRGQSPFDAPDVVAPVSLERMAAARELGVGLFLPPSFHSMVCDRVLAGDAPWGDDLTPRARLILKEFLAARATGPDSAHAGPKTGIRPCRLPWDWPYPSVWFRSVHRECASGQGCLRAQVTST
jgi:hypothetical protein